MTKRKLQRFEELKTFKRVFEYPPSRIEELPALKGNWNSQVFHREAPIIVEIGCGRGEYTIGLAKKDPEANYIGLDIKGARLWRGAKTANEENMLHVAFIRTVAEFIDRFFSEGELSEIWITFPDPQPTLQREKRRLTHPDRIDIYKKLLKREGMLHLKTDNTPFFQYTVDVLAQESGRMEVLTYDLYHEIPGGFDLSVQTTYEMKYLSKGHKINYLRYRFS